MLRKLLIMFGMQQKSATKPDPIAAQTTIAVQRNERAGENARKLLEEMRMADTMRVLTGKMK